jgi:Domain of unknown function (DUF151)
VSVSVRVTWTAVARTTRPPCWPTAARSDARPSDALTLALVTGAAIAVGEAVLDAATRFAQERPELAAEVAGPAGSASVSPVKSASGWPSWRASSPSYDSRAQRTPREASLPSAMPFVPQASADGRAAQDGPGEEGGQRVQRDGEDERAEPGSDEHQAQRLGAGRAFAALLPATALRRASKPRQP